VDVAVDVGGATGAFVLAGSVPGCRAYCSISALDRGPNSSREARPRGTFLCYSRRLLFRSQGVFLLKYVIHGWDGETYIRLPECSQGDEPRSPCNRGRRSAGKAPGASSAGRLSLDGVLNRCRSERDLPVRCSLRWSGLRRTK
jgi:hypothetical protein